MKWLLIVAASVSLACGCSHVSTQGAPGEFLLRLSPAALGTQFVLQQQITVDAGGQTRQIEALLEADASTVRLAMLDMGIVRARLSWDGTTLRHEFPPQLPRQLDPGRILTQIQLAYWPQEAIRAALPQGWTLEATQSQRVLSRNGVAEIRIEYLQGFSHEWVNVRDGYRIRVLSMSQNPEP
ncbi:MAG: DUF3261 domain-containing protein [Ramlibacter sp.]|jgi:hypothetical protein|nr:DUF3261 domain-containing protein [Ramlibacter sp.]